MKDVTQVVTLKSVTNFQLRWHSMSPKCHRNMWHSMWLRKEDRIGGIGPRLPRCDYNPHIRGIQLCIAAQVARRACDTRDTQLWHTWHRPASNSDVFGLILTLSFTILAWNSKFFSELKKSVNFLKILQKWVSWLTAVSRLVTSQSWKNVKFQHTQI